MRAKSQSPIRRMLDNIIAFFSPKKHKIPRPSRKKPPPPPGKSTKPKPATPTKAAAGPSRPEKVANVAPTPEKKPPSVHSSDDEIVWRVIDYHHSDDEETEVEAGEEDVAKDEVDDQTEGKESEPKKETTKNY